VPAPESIELPTVTDEHFPIDTDTAWLLGLIAADGSVNCNATRKHQAADIRISLSLQELELAERAVAIGTNLGLHRYKHGRPIVRAGNKLVARLPGGAFTEWVNSHIGHGAYGKHVPEAILHSADKHLTQAFLRGFWDGDGYASGETTGCATVNEQLVQGLQFLMARMGVIAGLSVSNQDGRVINGCPAVYRNPEGIFHLQSKSPLAHAALGYDAPQRGRSTKHWVNIAPHLLAVKITGVNTEPYKGKVYNLETTEGSYTTNNVAVHNCHQGQFETMPDFDAEYEAESRYVDEWGLQPYENRLERPAYEREVEAYLAALEAGYPPGEHTPLLIHDGAAAEGFVSGISRGFAIGIGLGLAGMIFALAKARK